MRKTQNYSYLKLISLLALSGAFVGCANHFDGTVNSNDQRALASQGDTYPNAKEGDMLCPSTENIKPLNFNPLFETDKYKVCVDQNDVERIQISGSTRNAPSICLFPMEYIDEQNIYVKPDLSTGWLVHACIGATRSVNEAGTQFYEFTNISVKFKETKFNALIVVKEVDKDILQECLAGDDGPNFHQCPNHSYGRFK
jgi:hypothetical protein